MVAGNHNVGCGVLRLHSHRSGQPPTTNRNSKPNQKRKIKIAAPTNQPLPKTAIFAASPTPHRNIDRLMLQYPNSQNSRCRFTQPTNQPLLPVITTTKFFPLLLFFFPAAASSSSPPPPPQTLNSSGDRGRLDTNNQSNPASVPFLCSCLPFPSLRDVLQGPLWRIDVSCGVPVSLLATCLTYSHLPSRDD